MKNTIFILTLAFFSACNTFSSSKTGSIKEAEQEFITEVQYMTEKESISDEISYYKDPDISVSRKVRDLTGRDAVHECNILLKENEIEHERLMSGQSLFGISKVWMVSDEKEYAINHPDEIVGAEYYFEGTFTHYNNGYELIRAKVLYINGSWIVIRLYH